MYDENSFDIAASRKVLQTHKYDLGCSVEDLWLFLGPFNLFNGIRLPLKNIICGHLTAKPYIVRAMGMFDGGRACSTA